MENDKWYWLQCPQKCCSYPVFVTEKDNQQLVFFDSEMVKIEEFDNYTWGPEIVNPFHEGGNIHMIQRTNETNSSC